MSEKLQLNHIVNHIADFITADFFQNGFFHKAILRKAKFGKVFDNRDHSTVLYSLKQVEKQMKTDPAFAETVKEIKANINNRS